MNKYIITILSILLSYNLVSQNAILKGKITDISNNQPVPFANIIVAGTQIGSTSDFDGNFIITGLNPGYVKLQISFIGYKTKISSDILLSNNKHLFSPFKQIKE